MRRLGLMILLAACAPDEREAVNDSLPDGVYEPAPGEAVGDVSLATDGDTVWWAYTSSYDAVEHVWLHAATPTGAVRVEQTMVDPDSDGYAPDQGSVTRTIGSSQPNGPETPSIIGLTGVQQSDGQ